MFCKQYTIYLNSKKLLDVATLGQQCVRNTLSTGLFNEEIVWPQNTRIYE